jgi:5'-phosphate synthase pdxT subunit
MSPSFQSRKLSLQEDGNIFMQLNISDKKDVMDLKVGILALQGAFKEHIEAIKKCGAEAVEIKFPEQLNYVDGLIIPGGESTTIDKLLKKYKFKEVLDNFFKMKKPIFGTCAGLILLAKKVNSSNFGLGFIDIVVERNAYGRQIDSFEEFVDLKAEQNLNGKKFHAVFIRAPKIKDSGAKVKSLGMHNGSIILARQENVLVCAFHPELTDDIRIHQYFVDMIKKSKYDKNI